MKRILPVLIAAAMSAASLFAQDKVTQKVL